MFFLFVCFCVEERAATKAASICYYLLDLVTDLFFLPRLGLMLRPEGESDRRAADCTESL